MQQLNINPELHRLIPPLTPEEFSQLTANILAEGIREPIITWNGIIVDGHNRYQIAQEHSLEFDTSEMQFESINHCKKWMAENQLGRRNLLDYDRGVLMDIIRKCLYEIGLLIKKQAGSLYGEGHAKDDQEVLSIIDKSSHNTRKIIADKLGWSTGKLAQFDVVHKNASEEVKQQLRSGEVSINKAYKDIKKEEKAQALQERKQRELIEFVYVEPVAEQFNVKAGDVWLLGKHTLTCGSAYNYLDNIATAIITDPPYGIDYAPDWKKCDGSPSDFKKIEGDQEEFDPRPFLNRETVVLFGANYFTRHLPQGSWICWDKRTKDELDDMFGSPFELAWFKSPKTTKAAIMIRVLHGGVVNADAVYGYDASRSHPTQKPIILFEDILKKLTNEGETVCDPFCGSGTTLLAAENTGRTCIAYEIDPAYCNVILQRYVQLTNQTPWKV
jgi:DNA modification methylase